MGTSYEEEKKKYAEFEQRVKRTVFIDNLSPLVTAPVLKTALGQFGNVLSVEFIPNYLIPQDIPQSALVEMENEKQASSIVSEMTNYPFMMAGAPRPVRARTAKPEMFADRPRRPGMKVQVRWLDPSDPDFEVANKMKNLVKKHAVESAALLKYQLEEEEKLAKQQADMLKANYKKFEMVESVTQDGAVFRLASNYGINLAED